MTFMRYGTTYKVDEFGALWFEADPDYRHLTGDWVRWCGIDL